VQALGVIGGDKQAAALVKLLQKTQSPEERAGAEKALLALSGRAGAACLPHLRPLMNSGDSALRMIGLHALVIVGGPEALTAVKTALNDKDPAVQDEAARTLSTWPNNWPGDAGVAQALLTLAKSSTKTSHQVLGLRGYLQYVRGDEKLGADDKVARVDEVLPLIQRAEEKRLAIAVLGAAPTPGALESLTALAADPAAAEEACSALLKLASGNIPGLSTEQRRSALQTVVDKSSNNATRRKAENALKAVR
jgi:hypothetical protein